MSTFRKDDIGYESGGWPATDLPSLANPAAKPPARRKGRRMAVRLGILASLAISYLLYYYADVILQVGSVHSIVSFITSLFKR
jgi:hypothetical protein